MDKPFAAYKGDEPYVFVCYAHEDGDIVYPELTWLNEQGLNLWYDEGISAGQNWRAAIGESLLGASRVLFYISRQSLDSDHCDREINLALDKGKEIVPVYLEDVELTPDLMVGLTRVQALHRDQDAIYQQHLLNALGQSTPTVKPQEIGKTIDTKSLAIRKGGYLVGVMLLFVIGLITVQQFGSSDVTTVDDKSIAVLPLENLSPDPDNAYFAAGIHAEILNLLQKIPGVRVIPRRSVSKYQQSDLSISEIANELNVSTIMDGSVRFAGNNVRVDLQLTRADDGANLWSVQLQFVLDDIFAIQSDVALQVANAMQATLSPDEIASIERPATESTEAYTLFLQHRYQQEQENVRQSLDEDGWVEVGIHRMERAIEIDQTYATAIAELGFLKWFKARLLPPSEEKNNLTDEALIHANKAIDLDPNIASAYVVLQRVYFDRRQWDEWESYARKSIELPGADGGAAFSYAWTHAIKEQYDEAYKWFDVAISKNPSSAFFREYAVLVRIWGRDYETALAMAEQYRAVGGDENVYHIIRAYTLNRLDRQDESLKEYGEISTESILVTKFIQGFHDYLRCQSGEQGSVTEELQKQVIAAVREIRIVYCAAGVGDLNAMFESFQRSMSLGLIIEYSDVNSDEVRADPRWKQVEDYMDLPDRE